MISTCDCLHTAEAPIHLTGSPWSPVRVGGQRATLWHLSNGSRGLQGLQALSPRRWPPPGAFIKLPALRVVHDLEKGGLVYILDGVGILPYGCGQGIQPHRATGELVYDAPQQLVVNLVQTQGTHLQLGQGFPSNLPCYSTIGHNLSIVPGTLEEPVGYPGRAPKYLDKSSSTV